MSMSAFVYCMTLFNFLFVYLIIIIAFSSFFYRIWKLVKQSSSGESHPRPHHVDNDRDHHGHPTNEGKKSKIEVRYYCKIIEIYIL